MSSSIRDYVSQKSLLFSIMYKMIKALIFRLMCTFNSEVLVLF